MIVIFIACNPVHVFNDIRIDYWIGFSFMYFVVRQPDFEQRTRSATIIQKTIKMMNATTKKYNNNKTTTTGDATKERHQQWTTKHWLSAVLVPAVFFLSVVVVSNSNYGKSVEEVTALMAEKETLLAQDQNANESDPEASTEEISSRVNVPTEEEEAMEELR